MKIIKTADVRIVRDENVQGMERTRIFLADVDISGIVKSYRFEQEAGSIPKLYLEIWALGKIQVENHVIAKAEVVTPTGDAPTLAQEALDEIVAVISKYAGKALNGE